MNYRFEPMMPIEIERRSMSAIKKELGGREFPPEVEPVVLRAIPASADFDYEENLAPEGATEADGFGTAGRLPDRHVDRGGKSGRISGDARRGA